MRPSSTARKEGKRIHSWNPPPRRCCSPAGAGPGPLLSPSLPASLAAAQRLRCEAATAGSMDGGKGRGRRGFGAGPGAVQRRLSAPRRGAAGHQRRPRCRPPAPAPAAAAAAMVRLHAGRAPLTGAGRDEGRG